MVVRLEILTLALMLIFCSFNFADEIDIGKIRFGPYAYGDKVNLKKGRNYIVLMHFWSATGEKSKQETSTLRAFYRKYRDKGVLVIGVHEQTTAGIADKAAVWKFCKSNKIPYMVVMQADLPKKITQVPHSFVFDAGGKLVYDGSLAKGLKTTKRLVKNYPRWILGKRKIKVLKSEARQIATRKNLGKLYNKLQKLKTESDEPPRKKEVEYLLERLENYQKEQREEFVIFKARDPKLYLDKCKQHVKTWKGHPQAEALREELKALRSNKAFQDSVKASIEFESLESMFYSLKPARFGETLKLQDAKFRKKNKSLIKKILRKCDRINNKYSATVFAQAAMKVKEELTK